MRKLSKKQLDMVREIVDAGGVIASSLWTNGSGRYITKRPIPAGCREYERWEFELPSHVEKFFNDNPKKQKCIALIVEA